MDVINGLSRRSRGHCPDCATPWGCLRPWCGCHGEPYSGCGCGEPLFVAAAPESRLAEVEAWLRLTAEQKQERATACWNEHLERRRS